MIGVEIKSKKGCNCQKYLYNYLNIEIELCSCEFNTPQLKGQEANGYTHKKNIVKIKGNWRRQVNKVILITHIIFNPMYY